MSWNSAMAKFLDHVRPEELKAGQLVYVTLPLTRMPLRGWLSRLTLSRGFVDRSLTLDRRC